MVQESRDIYKEVLASCSSRNNPEEEEMTQTIPAIMAMNIISSVQTAPPFPRIAYGNTRLAEMLALSMRLEKVGVSSRESAASPMVVAQS